MAEVKVISSKGLAKDLINGCSVLNVAKYFVEDGSQNCALLQLVFKYFKTPANNNMAMAWKSKCLPDESIKPPAKSENSLKPRLGYLNNSKFQVEFYGSCLKPDEVTFAPNKIINVYITCKIRL